MSALNFPLCVCDFFFILCYSRPSLVLVCRAPPGVVSVAAIDEDRNVASFSQRNRNVDIAAPGVDVLSTFPTDGCSICDNLGVKKYGTISGTSMATPHVSGVAALLRGAFPAASAIEIIDAMLNSAVPLGSNDRDNSYGSGLVQAIEALKSLNGGTLPGNPTTPGTPQPPSNGDCPAESLKVDVSLVTDNSGNESFWWILRGDGYPMVLGSRLESNNQYTYSDCLPSDCYTFTLYDTGGNGLCCQDGSGGYSISVNNDIIGENESFSGSISHSFGVCASTDVSGQPNIECVSVSSIVKTDQYPEENAVKLVDERDGTVIWSRDFTEKETIYDDMVACVDPSGCYTFTIDDLYGDGVCCAHGDGYVTLNFDGEELVFEEEAAFGSGLSVSFGKCD